MKRPFYSCLGFVLAGFLVIGTPAFSQTAAKTTKTPSTIQKKRSPASAARKSASSSRIYTVKNGDSLYSIARANRTTVEVLMSANGMKSNRLQVGQQLSLAGTRPKPKLPAQMPAWYKAAPSSQVAMKRADDDQDPTVDPPDSSGRNADGQVATSPASAQPASPNEADDQPLRIQLASTGLGFLGVPYRRSGNSEESGFDCSGFVKSLYERFQISLPRSSREQYKVGEKIDKDKLEVGDLVFFTSGGKVPSHVGVYIGDNQILHAARRAKQVIISSLSGSWYAKRFLGARRLQDLWADETPAAENKSN